MARLLRLWKMSSIELVDDLSRSLDDLHGARRVGMTAQRNLVVAYRKLDLFATDCGDCRILDLTAYVLLRFIGMPCPLPRQHWLK